MSDIEPSMPIDSKLDTDGLSTAAFAHMGDNPSDGREAGTYADGSHPSVPEEPRSFDAASSDGRQPQRSGPLLDEHEVGELRTRWTDIQAGFVDEPRKAVENADGLVALTMKRLAEMFAEERSTLEGRWDQGDQVSTEDLRVALQRYRSFFDRLLSF